MIEIIKDADYPPPPEPVRRIPVKQTTSEPPSFLPFCNSGRPLMNFRKPINLKRLVPGKKEQPETWSLEPMEG